MVNESVVSIVDDDASIRQAIATLLRSVDVPVATFASAEAFLGSRELPETACMILDLRMPGMDGFGLQQRLVDDNRRIPIVFLTAHADGAARTRAIRAGAVAFMRKPFDGDTLLGVVQSALTSRFIGLIEEVDSHGSCSDPEQRNR